MLGRLRRGSLSGWFELRSDLLCLDLFVGAVGEGNLDAALVIGDIDTTTLVCLLHSKCIHDSGRYRWFHIGVILSMVIRASPLVS